MSSLPTRLRDALTSLTPDRPDAIEALRALYSPDIVFRDPIQTVHGMGAFIAMNHRLVKKMRTMAWDVKLTSGDDHVALLEWTMTGTAMLGAKVQLDGMTRARAHDGLIVDHRDYWDVGELMASPIPGGQRLLHLLRLPLA